MTKHEHGGITTVTATFHPETSDGEPLLAPVRIRTPHQTPVAFFMTNGALSLTGDRTTGQIAALTEPATLDIPMARIPGNSTGFPAAS